GTSQDCEGGHVRGEQRHEEDHRSDRTAGEEEVFGVVLALTEGDASNVERDRKINDNDDNRCHQWPSWRGASESWDSSTSRCSGQAKLTSTNIMIAQSTE